MTERQADRLHPSCRRVVEAAAARGLAITVTSFPEGTRTAADAAAAIGCELGAIVKSIVLDSDDGCILALVGGAHRVDTGRVAAALSTGNVRRADAEAARRATGYPIGGTAPLGHPQPLPVLFDPSLLGFEEVWAAAGTPTTVFVVGPRVLLEVSGGRLVDVAA